MKKLIVALALVLGTSMSTTAFAQTQPVQEKTVQQGEKEVAVTELPAAIQEAVKKDHPNAVISSARVNGNNEYTLTLTADGKSQTVHTDANGKWIKRD